MSHHTSINLSLSFCWIVWRGPWRVVVSGYRLWSLILINAHKFSIGLISGEFDGHSIITNPCSIVTASKKAQVFLDTWGLVLSCWNVIPYMSSLVNASRYGRRLLRRMSIYTSLLTVSLMNAIGPNLFPTKHPQIISKTSLSLVFPRMFFSAYFSFFLCRRKTHTCWQAESFWIAVSSDHAILAQSSHVLCWCSCIHLRCVAACCSCNNDCLTALHFCIRTSGNRRWIVDFDTSTLVMLRNSAKGTCIWVSAAAIMCLFYVVVVIRGRPWCSRFAHVPRFLRRVIKLDTVQWGILNEREIASCDIDTIRSSILALSTSDKIFRSVKAMVSTEG